MRKRNGFWMAAVLVVSAAIAGDAGTLAAPRASGPLAQPALRLPAAGPGAGGICRVGCERGVQPVAVSNERGECASAFRVPCYPSSCDAAGSQCRDACSLDTECAPGAMCNQAAHQCVVYTQRCSDAFTIEDSRGNQSSCAPYRCAAGSCRSVCNKAVDCASGYQCLDGRCAQ